MYHTLFILLHHINVTVLTFTHVIKACWSGGNIGLHSSLADGIIPSVCHGSTTPEPCFFHANSNPRVHTLQEGCWCGKKPEAVTFWWLGSVVVEDNGLGQTFHLDLWSVSCSDPHAVSLPRSDLPYSCICHLSQTTSRHLTQYQQCTKQNTQIQTHKQSHAIITTLIITPLVWKHLLINSFCYLVFI